MILQTKALYNLLRLNAAEDPSVEAEPWALEDLRPVSLEELFLRLDRHGISLDRYRFLQFAKECDTPEELTDVLLPDETQEEVKDPCYLLIFELWRKVLPEKQSLSIFCDELDHRISLYDLGDLTSDEPIQDVLANLLEVLDENADAGADPEEVFRAISEYCAHDLEVFLYDYISDLLDSGNALYASELIEDFSPYMGELLGFDFLRIRLIARTDISEANVAMHRLLQQDLDKPLLLEIIQFLSANGEHDLFKQAIKKVLPLCTSQEELTEVISWIADFYRRLDEDEKEKAVQRLLLNRPSGPLQPSDRKMVHDLVG